MAWVRLLRYILRKCNMSVLTYITHPVYKKHDTGHGHPERPDRIMAIDEKIERSLFSQKMEIQTANEASTEQINLVHDPDYSALAAKLILDGQTVLDAGDTVVSTESWAAATFAAGAGIQGVDVLKLGKSNRVFCTVRPPGHHAERDRAMGFCILNNVAIAARYAQISGLAEKVLIVDWDVHHGNGTQHIFDEDDTVFYYSMHQYPFYPGTGTAAEQGHGAGTGFTLNRPLAYGSGNKEYISALENDLTIIEDKFKADLVIVSAGFDAHKDDPLGGMMLTEEAYWKFTEMIALYAWRHSEGRILSILEGGYNLRALADSVLSHLDCMIKH